MPRSNHIASETHGERAGDDDANLSGLLRSFLRSHNQKLEHRRRREPGAGSTCTSGETQPAQASRRIAQSTAALSKGLAPSSSTSMLCSPMRTAGRKRDMSRRDMSTIVRPSAKAVTVPRSLALHVLTQAPSVHFIDKALVAGRSAECDIAIPTDGACSRVHLRIVPRGDALQIADLGSRNGTFVDGRRVTDPITIGGGVLRFGDTVAAIVPRRDELDDATDGPLIGGASLAKVRRVVSLTATTELPLLIAGETGAGKEVVAQWVHALSGRVGQLVAVNCAALPESLLEGELFGHVKGAFTGAIHGRRGLVAAAASGTLFLDELGEMPLAVQAKLLRVLEDRVVRPIGADGSAGEPVDFRVISATNADLTAAIAHGTFRADLYARLAAVAITLPPLRTRIEDLPALIDHLLRRAGVRSTVGPDALEALARFAWPHNVRQLDYALRNASALSPTCIELEHLPEAIRAGFRDAGTFARASRHADITRDELAAALRQHRGNVRRVGYSLGIPRSRLYRLLAKWSLDPRAHRVGTASARKREPA
jgi:transcriptional regulator with AAA-type ATPase domain